MTKNTIENEQASVQNQNLIDEAKNKVVAEATQKVFEEMMALENISILSEIITEEITTEFVHKTFMTDQLELTSLQKEKLLDFIKIVATRGRDRYLNQIKKEERTKRVANVVEINLNSILEQLLSSLAQEVNRGALINCVAVAADTKNEKYNKIELNTYKSAGDITIPTRCLLVSTNCLDLISHSITKQMEPTPQIKEQNEKN